MGWMEGRKNHLEWSVKSTTKALAAQTGMLVLNIAGIGWNLWFALHTQNPSFFNFGIGAFSSNTLWTAGFVARYWCEIRDDKAELKYLRELELKEQLEDDRKIYQGAKEMFENALDSYKKEIERLTQKLASQDQLGSGKKKPPRSPASINPDIQPATN